MSNDLALYNFNATALTVDGKVSYCHSTEQVRYCVFTLFLYIVTLFSSYIHLVTAHTSSSSLTCIKQSML